LLRATIPCICGCGASIGPHHEVFRHCPHAFWYPADERHEAPDSSFRKASHEAGHLLVAKAVGAIIDGADIEDHEAHSGAAYIRFPEAMKAQNTRFSLAQGLVCLGGVAAELAILGDADLARHEDHDLKRYREATATCQGQWKTDVKDMLLAVLQRYIKGHEQATCQVARQLQRYGRLKGSDVTSTIQAMGGVEPLTSGNWETDLLRRMKEINRHMEEQIGYKAVHRRILELSAQDV
jgi:hypothetical protein